MTRERLIQAIIAAIIAFLTALGVNLVTPSVRTPQSCPLDCPCAPIPLPIPHNPDGDEPLVVQRARAATVSVRMGSAFCTGTIVRYPHPGGQYYVVCAAHCITRVNDTSTIKLRDGRSYKAKVIFATKQGDISIHALNPEDDLPFAKISSRGPQKGEKVFHVGYGVRRPGSLEYGECLRPSYDGDTWADYRIDASSGDSGSGIFLASTGDLVGILCGYHRGGTYGPSWWLFDRWVNRDD